MRRATATLMCCLVLAWISGCPGVSEVGFGPFPTSGFGGGQITAGVAGFIPGVVPAEGEFSLLVVNTDALSSHRVTVTAAGALGITRDIAPCGVGNYAVSCDAATILVEIEVPGAATLPTLTLTPVVGACTQRLVYIAVEVQDTTTPPTDEEEPAAPPSLTETVPPSAANCGLGGLPNLPIGQ